MKKFISVIALLCMVVMVAAPSGAVTFTKLAEGVMGNLRTNVYQVTFDSSYPSGGEDISQITTGNFGTVLAVIPNMMSDGYIPVYDDANAKIIVYVSSSASGMQAVNPGASLAGSTTRLLILGW